MSRVRTLDVFYHNRPVGTLAETPDKRIAFQYNAEWLKNGFSISPLSLPLNSNVFLPAESSRDRFGGLFGIFADSIPDSWGQLLLGRYLSSMGISEKELSTLDRLAYIGDSGMGALSYHPSKETDFDLIPLGIDYDRIAKECAKILSSKPSDQIDFLFKLGGSGGGTRPKILVNDNDGEWIVKFPAKNDPNISGKREYDYSLCAKECGIIMTETGLVASSLCDGYFKTKRFDRESGTKVFTATFAALLEADFMAPSCDYETLMKLVSVLTKDNISDKEQLFKIMCFNVFTHNLDDHAKNFSFIFTEDSGWRLAPAYDLTYSDTYFGEHTTSVNGKGKDITDDDLISVGTTAGLRASDCRTMLDEVKEKTQVLSDYHGKKKLPKRKGSLSEGIKDIQDNL